MTNSTHPGKKKRGRKSKLERQLGPMPDYILSRGLTPLGQALMDFAEKATEALMTPYRGNPLISVRLAAELSDMGNPELSSPANDARIIKEYNSLVKKHASAPKKGGNARVSNAHKRRDDLLKSHPKILKEFLAGEYSIQRAAEILLATEKGRLESGADTKKLKLPGHSTLRAELAKLRKASSEQAN